MTFGTSRTAEFPAALYPKGNFLVLISGRGWVDPQGYGLRTEGSHHLKISRDPNLNVFVCALFYFIYRSVLFIHCVLLCPPSSCHFFLHNISIHAPGGFRTRSPSKRSTADPRLRPLDHWDWWKSSPGPPVLLRIASTSCFTSCPKAVNVNVEITKEACLLLLHTGGN